MGLVLLLVPADFLLGTWNLGVALVMALYDPVFHLISAGTPPTLQEILPEDEVNEVRIDYEHFLVIRNISRIHRTLDTGCI